MNMVLEVPVEPEIEEPQPIKRFYWLFRREDVRYDTDVPEGKEYKAYVNISFTNGKHKWVPATSKSAAAWFLNDPAAEPFRNEDTIWYVGTVFLTHWEDTRAGQEGEPPPDDWLQAPLLFDESEDHPDMLNEKYDGYVISLPLKFEAKVMLHPSFHMTAHPKMFAGMQFSIMPPEEVLALSVMEVISVDTVTETRSPTPIKGGLVDGRMGANEWNAQCVTCALTLDNQSGSYICPGHYGHITLPIPIPHFLFLGGDYKPWEITPLRSPLLFALNHTCHSCYRVMIPEDAISAIRPAIESLLSPGKRNLASLRKLHSITSKAVKKNQLRPPTEELYRCPHCEADSPQVEFKYSGGQLFRFSSKAYRHNKELQPWFFYNTMHEVLRNISDEDARLLAFNAPLSRPEGTFIEHLLVAPNTIRPMMKKFGTETYVNNDLTLLYQQVVRLSNRIRKGIARQEDPSGIEWNTKNLFKAVTNVFWNQSSAIGALGSQTVYDNRGRERTQNTRGLLDRFKGVGNQKNRVRSIIASKRVNTCARSVITPTSDVNFNEVIVPIEVAATGTIEVKVTEENIDFLRQCVINGCPEGGEEQQTDVDPRRYPGATRLYRMGLTDDVVPKPVSVELADRSWADGWGEPTLIAQAWDEYKQTLPIDGEFNFPRAVGKYSILDDVDFSEAMDAIKALSDERVETAPQFNAAMEALESTVRWDSEWLLWEDPRGIRSNSEYVKSHLKEEKATFRFEWNQENRRVNFAERIQVGDMVTRNVIDGDWMLFNRQPSLHRQSVMGVRARIGWKDKAFAFNPTICAPYNADYDGDAMNLHFINGKKAIEEVEGLMDVKKNLIHNRTGKLAIATDQDQTTGLYLLTFADMSKAGRSMKNGVGYTKGGHVYFDKARTLQFMAAAYHRTSDGEWSIITELPEPDVKGGYWSGRVIISHIIPPGINARFENAQGEEVVVIDGQLITGTVDEIACGERKASLAPAFFYRYGYEEGHEKLFEFLHRLTRIGLAAHEHVGYTIDIEDCRIDEETISALSREYDATSIEMAAINRDFNEKDMGKHIKSFEDRWLLTQEPYAFADKLLSEKSDAFEKSAVKAVNKSQTSSNNIQISTRSGARGSDLSTQQMSGMYGQITIGGTRPRHGVSRNRMLPHFPLTESYTDEEGKTRIRQLPLEHPRHTGFSPGSYSRGFEPTDFFLLGRAGIRATIESAIGGLQMSGWLENELRRSLESFVVDEERRVIDLRTNRVVSFLVGDDGLSPYHSRMASRSLQYVDDPLNRTIELQPYLYDHFCKHGAPLAEECHECAKGSAYHEYFLDSVGHLPSQLMVETVAEYLLTREVMKREVDRMIVNLIRWYEDSLCRIGEAIGSCAGGNIGEPASQATLRTFHMGGRGKATSVTDLRRVLRASDTGSETTVRLKEEYDDEKHANRLANFCSPYFLEEFLKDGVEYDIDEHSLKFRFDEEKMKQRDIDVGFAYRQVKRIMKSGGLLSDDDDVQHIFKVEGDDHRSLSLAKENLIAVRISGLRGSKGAFPVQREGRWTLSIMGAGSSLWSEIETLLEDFVEVDSIWCDNPKTVLDKLGLETALLCLEEQLSLQMNGAPGISGIAKGNYDYRYIRTIIDAAGYTGTLIGVGQHGGAGAHNPSMLAAISFESPVAMLVAGVTMANQSNFDGVTESVDSGRTVRVGREYYPR
jgi:DNA-directed RNA polymerase beta' subunit